LHAIHMYNTGIVISKIHNFAFILLLNNPDVYHSLSRSCYKDWWNNRTMDYTELVLTQLSCKLADTLQSKMWHTQLTEHSVSDNIVQSKWFSPILPNPKSPNFILRNHKPKMHLHLFEIRFMENFFKIFKKFFLT